MGSEMCIRDSDKSVPHLPERPEAVTLDASPNTPSAQGHPALLARSAESKSITKFATPYSKKRWYHQLPVLGSWGAVKVKGLRLIGTYGL